ncbi:MAG: hypothetical protein GX149_04940 [Acholeplasmataceae bacterium]|jgi:hypothetical protein|nr:hypothetical protein [Acholeplasmataceae bacterium]
MDFFNKILDWIKALFSDFNNWMKKTINFDNKLIDLYNTIIAPLDEWIKILGFIAIAIILVFGIISLIKKAYKIVLVLVIIVGVIIILTSL